MPNDDPKQINLFPIRELCARTQVNSVTLRAWERRYGLLKPQRTDKGHRLYSDADVRRVEQIVEWIGRGVPVSRVKDLLEQPPQSALQENAFDDDRSGWQSAIDTLCGAALNLSADKTEHCLSEFFLNYPADTCREKLLEPTWASLQASPFALAACTFLQSEIIRYVIQRSAAGKHGPHAREVQLICGENTPIWRLATAALSLADAGLRVQLINQPCSVNAWLELLQTGDHQLHLIFQDGIWREEEKNRIKSALKPSLWLCGAAPMTSGIAEQNHPVKTNVFPSPESAATAIVNFRPTQES